VEVHPIVVIVALIVGGKVGGVLGMFVAVPCAALVKIYFERFVAWRAARLSHRGNERPTGD
jgi:predicted PurR-regulated permease PerM